MSKYIIQLQEEIEYYEKELKEQHMKEFKKIEKMKDEHLIKLEMSFQQKLDEAQKCYNENLQELTKTYEEKIKKMHQDNNCDREEKDKEIIRLSQNIQEQCARLDFFLLAIKVVITFSYVLIIV